MSLKYEHCREMNRKNIDLFIIAGTEILTDLSLSLSLSILKIKSAKSRARTEKSTVRSCEIRSRVYFS